MDDSQPCPGNHKDKRRTRGVKGRSTCLFFSCLSSLLISPLFSPSSTFLLGRAMKLPHDSGTAEFSPKGPRIRFPSLAKRWDTRGFEHTPDQSGDQFIPKIPPLSVPAALTEGPHKYLPTSAEHPDIQGWNNRSPEHAGSVLVAKRKRSNRNSELVVDYSSRNSEPIGDYPSHYRSPPSVSHSYDVASIHPATFMTSVPPFLPWDATYWRKVLDSTSRGRFRGNSFLTLLDFTSEEIEYLLDLSATLKVKRRNAADRRKLLEEKNVVLIFEKDSTRTRCAFEVAAFEEGAHVTYLSGSHLGERESVEDTARVLGSYYDGIMFRGKAHQTVQQLARYAEIPVWNGLTDLYHPTQALADLLTIREEVCTKRSKLMSQVKIVYVGNANNNVTRSLMIGAAKMGMRLVVTAPNDLIPDSSFVETVLALGQKSGAIITFNNNAKEAVRGADVIYTDVWLSMGETEQWRTRMKMLKDYRVDESLLKATGNEDVIFMHCLPAFHDLETREAKARRHNFATGIEVSDAVFRSRHSVVFQQAENRIHTIKAVMVATISDALS